MNKKAIYMSSNIREFLSFSMSDLFSLIEDNDFKQANEIREEIFKELKKIGEKKEIKKILKENSLFQEKIDGEYNQDLFIDRVFFQELELSDRTLTELKDNIKDAFIDEILNKDKLYRYSMADSITKEYFNDKNLSSFLQVNSENQIHEAQAAINFYLETFNISKRDIDELSRSSKDTRSFMIKIFEDINRASILQEPFIIDSNKKIVFQKQNNGLPDVFFYNNKKNEFSIGFATLDQGHDIEGKSIIKQPLTTIGILFALIENEQSNQVNSFKREETRQEKSIEKLRKNIISTFKDEFPEFDFMGTDHLTLTEKIFRGLGRNNNRRLINKLYTKIKKEFKKDGLSEDLLFENCNRYLAKHGTKINAYFLGKITSPSKNIENIGEYTPEEFSALTNIYAYKSKYTAGISSLDITNKETSSIIGGMNIRFNTSTKKKFNILKIDRMNEHQSNFENEYLNNFLFNQQKTGDNFQFSNDVLENMSLIDRKIVIDLADFVESKIDSMSETSLSNTNIDILTNSFFQINYGVKKSPTFKELNNNIKDKYKNEKDMLGNGINQTLQLISQSDKFLKRNQEMLKRLDNAMSKKIQSK